MIETTPSYADLLTDTASKITDAAGDFAHRSIRTSRSIWEILSKPYGTSDAKTIVSANFDRASEIAAVLTREAKAQIDATQRYNEMMLDRAANLQDAYMNAMRGILDISVSNVAFVREAAAVQVADISQRFEAYSTPAGAGASAN